MKVSRREPIKAWILMDALKEETRQLIIRLLLEKGEMTLTEIQEQIGKTLPTLLFHVNLLEKAGILAWKTIKREKKKTKVYYIKTKLLEIEVDLEIFSRIEDIKKIKELVEELIDKMLESQTRLKKEISIPEIARYLQTDVNKAIIIKDYITNHEEEIVKYLYEKLKKKIGDTKDPIEISEKLNIDIYWAARLIKYI